MSKESNSKIPIDKFKKLFIDVYNDFPNSKVLETSINDIILSENDRKLLCDNNYLIREKIWYRNKFMYFYGLGPNGLSLVTAWKTEELSKDIRTMTWCIVVLTAIMVLIGVMQLYFAMK
jgi:hypothetical protein